MPGNYLEVDVCQFLFYHHKQRSKMTTLSKTKDIIDHYFPDLILGANDGIITTFAVVAASQGAGYGKMIIITLGLANLFADGVSMGASNYLAQRSRNSSDHNVSHRNSIQHGIATFVGFMIAGALPLIIYLTPTCNHFYWAVAITFATSFAVGAARALFIPANWFKAGMEMFTIGVLAALIAFIVGTFVG